MGANFWWIFDIITVVVLVFCVSRCAKKGFSKMIVTAIGCVISLVVAWFASRYSADMVYDNFLKKNNIEAVKTAIEDYKPEEAVKNIIESNDLSGVLTTNTIKSILSGKNSISILYEYANSEAGNMLGTPESFKSELINGFAKNFATQVGVSLPPYVVHEITSHVSDNEELFISTINMLMKTPDKVPEYIEENYIRAPAKKIVGASVFLIIFFVLMTIILIVSSRSPEFGLLNGYDKLDRISGGLMGFIEGIAVIMIIAEGVYIMVNISESENSFISLKTVENTLIFRHFYKFL